VGNGLHALKLASIGFTLSWNVPPNEDRSSTMDTRKYWPFPIAAQETEESKRQASFFVKANEEGHKAYSDEGGVLGAVATNGREGAMIPRGGTDRGLRRYWEVILSQDSDMHDSFYLDGFENAIEAILLWLRGSEASRLRSSINEYIVQKPGQRGW